MRPSSDLFAAAVRAAHTLAVEVVASHPSGGTVMVPITSGTINGDRGQLVRRTLDLTIPGREWISHDPNHPLSPYGGQLTVRRGITFPDGHRELIDMGTFVIQSAAFDYHLGQTTITASDYMVRLVDDRFEAPRTLKRNASTVAVIHGLIRETIPGAGLWVSPRVRDRPYAGGATFEEDRAGAVAEIAASLSSECYADVDGSFILRRIPSLADPPLTRLASGPGGVLVSTSASLTREGVYNAVVARSEPTDPDVQPVTATVRDTRPGSPTRYNGPFGRKPRFYSSPLLNTVEQARATAAALLADSIGISRSLDLSAVPDPRLEPGDVIELDYGDLSEVHILDTLTIPLTWNGTLTATSRVAVAVEES